MNRHPPPIAHAFRPDLFSLSFPVSVSVSSSHLFSHTHTHPKTHTHSLLLKLTIHILLLSPPPSLASSHHLSSFVFSYLSPPTTDGSHSNHHTSSITFHISSNTASRFLLIHLLLTRLRQSISSLDLVHTHSQNFYSLNHQTLPIFSSSTASEKLQQKCLQFVQSPPLPSQSRPKELTRRTKRGTLFLTSISHRQV